METREKKGDFEDTREFQRMYRTLLAACDEGGNMVSQDRFLEHDKDISPYNFFRRATREYVFPQREAELVEDNSRTVDPTPGYSLRVEEQTFTVDESQVRGRIRIEYQDADNNPSLQVTDVQGDSWLPVAVRRTLEDIFEDAETS